jgi:hypothetical protein
VKTTSTVLRLSFLFAVCAGASLGAQAQDRIYRCPGNEYTNNATAAQQRGCKLVEGGNVTVVQGAGATGPAAGPAAAPVRSPAATASPAGSPRVDSADQRARDSDARMILETELKRAEARRDQLLKDYNNGEPEKMGIESRNHQRYLDRVADMKAQIARNDADIEGLKRELSRLPVHR